MKLTKSRLKQLIKEEIEAMKSSEGGSEKARFMQAVKSIQDVLEHHALSGADTYDPMDLNPDFEGSMRDYHQTRKAVLNDPAYIKAKDYLTGLKVKLDSEYTGIEQDKDKTHIVVRVSLPVGEYGPAGSDVYLELGDPDRLVKTGKRKGQPRIVDSIMISNDYTSAKDKVADVTR